MPLAAAPGPRSNRRKKTGAATTSRWQITIVPSVYNYTSPWRGGSNNSRHRMVLHWITESIIILHSQSCLSLSVFVPIRQYPRSLWAWRQIHALKEWKGGGICERYHGFVCVMLFFHVIIVRPFIIHIHIIVMNNIQTCIYLYRMNFSCYFVVSIYSRYSF